MIYAYSGKALGVSLMPCPFNKVNTRRFSRGAFFLMLSHIVNEQQVVLHIEKIPTPQQERDLNFLISK